MNNHKILTVCILVMGCLALGPIVNSARANAPLVIASVPWRNVDILNEIYRPMVKLLEDKLNTRVRFLVATDYKELGKRLNLGAADLGIFGPNSYVEAKDIYPGIEYLATCMQPTAHYNSLIIARKDSSITSLAHLKGKSFAFTDKGSTSGFLYPMLMLTSQGLNPETDFSITYFLKKHDKVYEAVARGSIDAGGVSRTALDRAKQKNGDQFRIIAESDPIPRNAVVAAAHVTSGMKARIRQILSVAAKDPVFMQDKSILKGFAVKSDKFYDIVRKARRLNP